MKGQSNSGFIKLHRNILNWEWYDDINTARLFIHLLLTVNYRDQTWHGIEIKRGSRVTSYRTLSEETKLSVQEIRTSLNHLISTQCVTRSAASKFTVISVLNYDYYQESTRFLTRSQQDANKVLTSSQQQIKNNKNIKNKKNIRSEGEASPKSPSSPNTYGRYKNVLLSHEEMEQLQGEFPDWEQRVERLSEYMAQSGRTYQNHLATIRAWARQDREEQAQKAEAEKSKERSQSYDIEEFEQWLEYGAPPTLG